MKLRINGIAGGSSERTDLKTGNAKKAYDGEAVPEDVEVLGNLAEGQGLLF